MGQVDLLLATLTKESLDLIAAIGEGGGLVVWGGWGKRWRGPLYRIGAPGDPPFCCFEVPILKRQVHLRLLIILRSNH